MDHRPPRHAGALATGCETVPRRRIRGRRARRRRRACPVRTRVDDDRTLTQARQSSPAAPLAAQPGL